MEKHFSWCYHLRKGRTRIQHLADSIEQPTMRVDLLLILSLENEDNLNRNQVQRVVGLGKDKLRCRVHRKLGRILTLTGRLIVSLWTAAILTSNIWATVSFPSTCFFITPSWYTPTVARRSRTLLSIASRPSTISATVIFCQAGFPSSVVLRQYLDCFVLQMSLMLSITPCKVRAYKVLSSLYDVTAISSSVSRLYIFVRRE